MAIAVDGVLALRALVEPDEHGVGVYARDDGAGASAVEVFAAVVVADAHEHPVAGLQRLADGGPQVGVERARRHASQRLVLHRNLLGVEIFGEVVPPSPLPVVAVAHGAVAHGAVAHEKHHRVLPSSCAAWSWPCLQGFGYRVGGVVNHLLGGGRGVGQVVEVLWQGDDGCQECK